MGSQGTLVLCAIFVYLVVAASAFPEKKPKRQNAFKLQKNFRQFIEKQKHRCIGMMMDKVLQNSLNFMVDIFFLQIMIWVFLFGF